MKVGQCVRAALPCSGVFACVHVYHPITVPILMEAQYPVPEDRLAGEESVIKVVGEGTSHSPLLMKGLTENSPSKGRDT